MLVSLLRQEIRNPQWPGSLGLSEPAVERRWTVTERGEDLEQARQEGETCIWALPTVPIGSFPCSSWSSALVTLVPMSALALTLCPAMVAPGGVILLCLPSLNLRILFQVVEGGLLSPWKEKSSVETSVPDYLVWLAEEPGDNEDYLTETNTDKWSTFLNSFQSTNFYFLSFSGALRNL